MLSRAKKTLMARPHWHRNRWRQIVAVSPVPATVHGRDLRLHHFISLWNWNSYRPIRSDGVELMLVFIAGLVRCLRRVTESGVMQGLPSFPIQYASSSLNCHHHDYTIDYYSRGRWNRLWRHANHGSHSLPILCPLATHVSISSGYRQALFSPSVDVYAFYSIQCAKHHV